MILLRNVAMSFPVDRIRLILHMWLSGVKYGDCNTTLRFELGAVLEYSGPYLSRGETRIEKFAVSLLRSLNHVHVCVQINPLLYSE